MEHLLANNVVLAQDAGNTSYGMAERPMLALRFDAHLIMMCIYYAT